MYIRNLRASRQVVTKSKTLLDERKKRTFCRLASISLSTPSEISWGTLCELNALERPILSESFFWTDIITISYLKSRMFFVSIRFLTLPWLRICLTKTSFHCCTALFHLTLPRTLPDWLSWNTFAGIELPPYDKMNTFLMRYWKVFAQSNAWCFARALHSRAISVSRVGPRRL